MRLCIVTGNQRCCDFKDVTCSCLRGIHTLYIVRMFLRGKRDIPVGYGPVKCKH